MLSVETARQIIAEAKSGEFEAEPMPETDQGILERGQFWLDEATKVKDAMAGNPTVATIIALGENGVVDSAFTKPAETPAAEAMKDVVEEIAAEQEEAPAVEETVDEVPPDPDPVPVAEEEAAAEPDAQESQPEQAVAESEAKADVTGEDLVKRENLPVPPEIQGDVPDMPGDLTGLDDRKIRQLHGEFNAYLGRVEYLLSRERMALHQAKLVLENMVQEGLRTAEKIDPSTEKPKLASVLEAEVNADGDVMAWRMNVQRHEMAIIELRGFQEIYARHISVLSREWSMRSEEYQRSGAKS
jgi:hypothetical protein